MSIADEIGLDRIGNLDIQIEGKQVETYQGEKGVTTYKVRVSGPAGSHVVHRRYKDFEELHHELFGMSSGTTEEQAASMPPKSFFRATFSKKFQDERERKLAEVASAALSEAADAGAESCPPALRKFLGLDDVQETMEVVPASDNPPVAPHVPAKEAPVDQLPKVDNSKKSADAEVHAIRLKLRKAFREYLAAEAEAEAIRVKTKDEVLLTDAQKQKSEVLLAEEVREQELDVILAEGEQKSEELLAEAQEKMNEVVLAEEVREQKSEVQENKSEVLVAEEVQQEKSKPSWSTDKSLLLCLASSFHLHVGRAMLIPTDEVTSVSDCVQQLNIGKQKCDAGICIVYSKSRDAYYVLYEARCKEQVDREFHKELAVAKSV